MFFNELSLPGSLLQGISEAGFLECTPIQEQTLPIALSGRDVAGQAQTGTGKTAAFLITLFSALLKDENRAVTSRPSALILAPTRELVVQIEKDSTMLGRHCGLTVQAIYGGVDYMKQKNALKEGADIVIGTPGRLIDYLKQRVYSLKHIKLLVIDEADRMFDMGFIPDLRYILRRLPPYNARQNLMFSATLNQRVMELSYEFMNLPVKVSVTPEKMTAERVEQLLYHVSRSEKFPLLLGLIRRDQMHRTMIFTNTKREAEKLQARLEANGLNCRVISGDVEQRKRMNILEQFKRGELPVIIATDVASRGLHIEGVSHVINYDLPQDAEDYVHRIGRTARAGAEGKAISMADEDGAFNIEAIEEYIHQKIPVEWAEDELFINNFTEPASNHKRGNNSPSGLGKKSHNRSGKVGAPQKNQQAASKENSTDKPARARKRRRPGNKASGPVANSDTNNLPKE